MKNTMCLSIYLSTCDIITYIYSSVSFQSTNLKHPCYQSIYHHQWQIRPPTTSIAPPHLSSSKALLSVLSVPTISVAPNFRNPQGVCDRWMGRDARVQSDSYDIGVSKGKVFWKVLGHSHETSLHETCGFNAWHLSTYHWITLHRWLEVHAESRGSVSLKRVPHDIHKLVPI